MIDRKQLKAEAKARMAQSDPSFWKVALAWTLVSAAVPQLVLSLAGGSSATLQKLAQLVQGGIDPELALRALQLSAGQITATWVLNIVLSVFQMVMSFGFVAYALRLWRGQPCGVPDIFSGFSMVGRVIGQQILVSLIAFGCVILALIPVTLAAIYGATADSVLGALLLVVICVAAAIFVIIILLNYALATTALADRPELGAMGSIQYGKNLIRGHKGQFVLLSLSFFGWALLCAIPSGVFSGLYTALEWPLPFWAVSLIDLLLTLPVYLWLSPYMQTTFSGFYCALRQQKDSLPQMPPL